MHPVGPLNSRTYWLRRVSVIVAAVIVLIGLGFLVIQKAKQSSAGTSNAAVVVSASPTPTLTGVLASPSSIPTLALAVAPAAGSSPQLSSSSKPVAATTVTTTFTPPVTTPTKTTPSTTSSTKMTSARSAPASTTASASIAVSGTSKTTAKPTATAPPAPTTDAQGRLLCSSEALKLQATTGSPSFALSVQPILGVSVTNLGAVACTRDLSGGLQVFTVYSAAGARIWSTADCFPGSGTDVRTIPAGQAEQYNINWSGTTSNPGCTADRVQVPAGRYQLRVDIGSLRATPVVFSIG